MQCPFCGQDNDKVVDSRSSEGGRAIRRRRQCLACGRRFTTYEYPEEGIRLKVIKKSGAIEMYEREKVIVGLQKACYKRPVSDPQIRGVVEQIEEELLQRFDKEVPSSVIGDLVMAQLQKLDKVAYVRFASVYRRFADVGELIEDAREVEKAPSPGPEQRKLFGRGEVPGGAGPDATVPQE
ncbi:MAG TPA: transcriptional regulator NrdR [Phycisphaerae bacterium]|nr:transcriptional regulator NrdR [Phycisphaerae bacterium]